MTKREAYDAMHLEGECDYALPQNWLDDSARILADKLHHGEGEYYEALAGQVVWQYDPGSIFGRPLALTTEGQSLLDQLN